MVNVRNFSIIAHIDHGKSTLADRLIQHCGLVSDREFHDQLLDNMDIERERGITIKSQTARLPFVAADGRQYFLNLIDTPGHVDFSYEVSRALKSCEGVVLLVDASQGVQAQTVANMYLAMENGLEIIPVINKIDLPSADIDMCLEQIDRELGLFPEETVMVSAKTGKGVPELLQAVVERIPEHKGNPGAPLQALIFDAFYDPFRGAVASIRVMNGTVKPGQIARMMSTGATHRIEEVGIYSINRTAVKQLVAGDVGYIIAGVKTVADTRIGDTVTTEDNPATSPLEEFRASKPVVFSSLYPVSTEDYQELADALEKYKLNDAALTYEKDSSTALGQGFRAGFLGLLHLEIVQERLEREFDQSLILTAPSVEYHFFLEDGSMAVVDNPAHYPDPVYIRSAEEPYIRASIMIPDRYMGAVMKLCLEKRGENSELGYPAPGRLEMRFDMPLAEVIFDFYDKLKSITQGYGSFDYEMLDYRKSDLVKLDILVNGEKVDALSMIVHRDNARARALQACERLSEEIPRQQFKVPIQGAIGGKIIARETIQPFRKDVTAKCYGGDISRKRKLLEKQKEGKRKMKIVGDVEIPQKAFIAVLKTKDD
ncbi:MAG TPA: translation elongation factor 4 [Myxococcota bacterium]|mgnify:CR=1 FL=1|nr:translation elongation factor 4 [Myxococcota bacterium]HOC99316.1 translation elongation factor 4 [Myxococcota bacterium]HOH77844.1 translation elongation factor 4 [Myxococcota bacterium]HPV04750.1 translation elongation factor 4 [Myxococcota bacterium]